MHFNPFDLFDSLEHDAGQHFSGYDSDHASNVGHHGTGDLSVDAGASVQMHGEHTPHDNTGGPLGPPPPFAEHDGYSVHGQEGGASLHTIEADDRLGGHMTGPYFSGHSTGDAHHGNDAQSANPSHRAEAESFVDGAYAEIAGHHLHAGHDASDLTEQNRVLESILDRHVSDAETAQISRETRWYDSHRGTSLDDLGNALVAHGVSVEQTFDTSLADLHDHLAAGDKVLAGLVGHEHPTSSVSLEAGQTAQVTDVHQDDRGQWFVTLREGGTHGGHEEQIPLERFVDSWGRCGRLALFAEPLPSTNDLQHSVGHFGTVSGPHHPTTSGDALDHHPDKLSSLPPGTIIGNPNHNVALWHGPQHHQDTCAVVSQKYIIEQFTGQDISEDVLMHEAQDHGWYQPGAGTPMEDVGKLLELHGVSAHHDDHATVEQLVNELGKGHEVIIGVDSKDLWSARDPNNIWNMLPHSHGANHVVVVSAIDTRDPENVQVLVTDPGTGDEIARYPIEQFLQACGDGNHFAMVATDNPVPSTAPEMARFDYEQGHIDQVAGVPWHEFLKRIAVPGSLGVLLAMSRKRSNMTDAAHYFAQPE